MVRKLKTPTTGLSGRARSVERTPDRSTELRRAADHYNAGRFDDARRIYGQLCERDPADAEAWFLRGLVTHQGGHHDDAVVALRTAVGLFGDDARRRKAQMWLAQAHHGAKQKAEASAVLRQLAREAWDDVEALLEITQLVAVIEGFDRIETHVARLLELSPDEPWANAEMSFFDYQRRDIAAAVRRAQKTLERFPDSPQALRVLAHVHHETGEVKEAVALYRQAIDGALAGKGAIHVFAAYESMLGAMVYADVSDRELREAHEGWQRLNPRVSRPRKAIRPRGNRPLRIGYVSADFRGHAVMFFFEPLLKAIHPEALQSFLYINSPKEKQDNVTQSLAELAFATRDIVDKTDDEVADLVETDEIDILVDLSGYTTGNRMGVFHLRAAPLQVNYLGYPCTTGLAQMDYRLTDEDCDPLGETDEVYTEKLVRLPGGFYAWQPPDTYPAGAPPPVLKNGFITFGSFNTLSKITDDVIALWSRLMRELPTSRLVLQAEPFKQAWVKERLLGKFAAHGIDAGRIDLLGRMGTFEHLELYNQIDIALDPFPWGGHTTTCTALFMSVPVVTLRGRRMASRMSASALHRMGFDAWIANSEDEYVQIVTSLAADVDRLATIRLAQRTVFAASGLMDGHRLARAIEAAFQAIWDHHAGEE
jgi:predicted O-linked N-acetylglucosamine transferase (SPINDLY family)